MLIEGNIFDSEYQFKYMLDYENPNTQKTFIEFKDPNIVIDNTITDNFNSPEADQFGSLNIKFLNMNNNIKYQIKESNIKFIDKNFKNSNFNLNGSINFVPFHFDLDLDIFQLSLSKLENFLYFLHQNKKSKYQNLSGILKINIKDLEHKTADKAFLKLNFENSEIYTDKYILYLKDFAILEILDFEYLQNNNQILQMKIKLNVIKSDKFNRFLFNFKKDKILTETLYFIYQYNPNDKNSFISQITNDAFVKTNEFYKFKNLQQLKNLLKDNKIFKLD